MKVRKKPIAVEGREFTGAPDNIRELVAWIGEDKCKVDTWEPGCAPELDVFTPTGVATAQVGDWVLQSPHDGHHYPIPCDEFHATYERVEG